VRPCTRLDGYGREWIENSCETCGHKLRFDEIGRQVVNHDASLNDPAIRQEAAEVLRSLIDRIELSPRKDGKGLGAVLHGDLAHILALCEAPNGKQKLPEKHISGSLLSVVAGACNHRELTLPPVPI
jgi:hypothetical protein